MERAQVTKTQLKNILARAALQNVSFEVSGRGNAWEVECSDRRTSVLVKRAMRRAGVYSGGYMAGWGGWIYRPYNPLHSTHAYTTDFCDPSSIHHY